MNSVGIEHTDKRGRRNAAMPNLDLTQTAEAAGITLSYLSKLLSGKRTPSVRVARRLAEAMGVELVALLDKLEELRGKAARPGPAKKKQRSRK